MILSLNGIIAGRGVVTSSLNTNLVSAYNFDNNLNDSFSTNNGTGFGGINYTTGLINQAVGFNGTNAYVELPNTSGQFNFTDDFSISLWIKPSTTAGFPFLINNYVNIGSNNYGYYLFITSTGLRLGIWNGANSAITDINQLPPSNVWSQIVITRKKSTITKIYINGVLTTPTSSTNPTLDATYQPNTIMTLGASFGNYKYTGWMDSLDFWNKELTATEVTELYNCGNGQQYPFAVLPSVDSDACAFIAAASITDNTQKSAINQLVLDLKSANIWTKMKAIYPFVGGTASSHKFNLKDPRDLDAAYRLVFNGGWTHSATGALPNGSNAYANPFYTNVTDNSSMWYYSRTNNTTNAVDMGVYNNPYSDTQISCYYGGTSWGLIRILSNGFTGVNWAATTSQGFFGANRTSSTLANVWYNGVKKGTNTNTSSQDPFTKSLFIGAYNSNTGATYFSNRESAFASIGDGLTDSEATALYNAVQTFNTTIGRQV